MRKFSIAYSVTTTEYFERLRPLGGAILLDSGKPSSERGRFDILVAAPMASLVYSRGKLRGVNLPVDWKQDEPPFQLLERCYTKLQQNLDTLGELPFGAGFVGHFSYDLGRTVESLPSHALDDNLLPEMQIGLYGWSVVIDHEASQAWLLVSDLVSPNDVAMLKQQVATATTTERHAFTLTQPFKSNVSEAEYHQKLAAIDEYIRAGDCYQVNFAQRHTASFEGDPWEAYKALREKAPTHYAAYFDTEHGAVLSLSPERFLTVNKQQQVITQPIKGTRPRDPDPQQDQAMIDDLTSAEKDRAENVMIVDLLRNDISKSCALNSVKVPKLFAVESYRNVHHLVSTVTGTLAEGKTPVALLEGAFPGGSITGAPKIRAMEIIDELEPHRRAIYCGSIGYISLSGEMDTSITIRTLLAENNTIHCWGGGGIVADSNSHAEYQETYDKVNNLLKTLEGLSER